MKKALFFRKCCNDNDYFMRIKNYSDLGNIASYKIYKTIKLTENDYFLFVNDFYKEQDFIIKHKEHLTIDSDDSINCLFITYNNITGFLVYPSGYNYSRYVAYINGGDDNV